ncbi:MAG: hypothetical protein HEQ24_15150 [Dolichospermum sp. BR01]|nr:hypothetical protein [Dolichospermum sp. BR01]
MGETAIGQLLVGAKHLEDKLSIIAKNSSPNASPVQLSVGAKHLEDKLSIIAKNSSPNASPVQLLLGRNIPPAPCPLPPVPSSFLEQKTYSSKDRYFLRYFHEKIVLPVTILLRKVAR